jgi:hypothetical protein
VTPCPDRLASWPAVSTTPSPGSKKHNQIIGKIGTFLGNVSGKIALAGLIIAPIPGLDALTPVPGGAAIATSLGARASQGIAKAAGDRSISYGDLFNDALGAIPAGDDAEDLDEGITTASHMTQDASDADSTVQHGLNWSEADDRAGVEHAVSGHTVGGTEYRPQYDSVWNEGADIGQMANRTIGRTGRIQAERGGATVEFVLDAGEPVGRLPGPGDTTSVFTVIRDRWNGDLITAHPGYPMRT